MTGDEPPAYRVVYVDTAAESTAEAARTQEEVCEEMLRRGLRLFQVVPIQTGRSPRVRRPLAGTTGVWLYFKILE